MLAFCCCFFFDGTHASSIGICKWLYLVAFLLDTHLHLCFLSEYECRKYYSCIFIIWLECIGIGDNASYFKDEYTYVSSLNYLHLMPQRFMMVVWITVPVMIMKVMTEMLVMMMVILVKLVMMIRFILIICMSVCVCGFLHVNANAHLVLKNASDSPEL